jgi:hypothetical protein
VHESCQLPKGLLNSAGSERPMDPLLPHRCNFQTNRNGYKCSKMDHCWVERVYKATQAVRLVYKGSHLLSRHPINP